MKKIEDFTVLGHKWLNYKTFIIEVLASEPLPDIFPGNFAEIEIRNSPRIFLRRPFSIYDVNRQVNSISFFVKVVGEGTRLLGELRKGDKVNLIYPLGNSFHVTGRSKVLIVAGGSGIAPFMMLGRALKEQNSAITFLFGARTKDDVVLINQFGKLGNVLVTTEDGSVGEKGLVTQHSIFRNASLPFDYIATCGPEPMMKAVSAIAMQNGITCQASLENTMACGFGACLSCVVATADGNKCVCTEGPVFNVEYLRW